MLFKTIIEESDGTITTRELVSETREILKSQEFTQQLGLSCSDEHADASFHFLKSP